MDTKEAAMSLLHYCMKRAPEVALRIRHVLKCARFASSIGDAHEEPGSYVEVVNYLFPTNVSEGVITKTVGGILSLRKVQGTKDVEFGPPLYDKVSRCRNVYPEC